MMRGLNAVGMSANISQCNLQLTGTSRDTLRQHTRTPRVLMRRAVHARTVAEGLSKGTLRLSE